MTKREFIEKLRSHLSRLPRREAEERIIFYVEMIDDRIEEGLSEEEAVFQIGSADEIASQIISEVGTAKAEGHPERKARRFKAWELLLLILGFPVWFPLIVAAIAVGFALYVVLWAMIGSAWAVFGAFAASSPAFAVMGIIEASLSGNIGGIALLGAGIALAGLAVFLFFGCKAASEGSVTISRKAVLFIKKRFAKRRETV